ncbi:MAG: transcriptional coactivator p15/PC4 family protein, partial [Hydrogenophaga sp.]|nr:transcriptional coactivator p15/PC4 family protein [Hydrogenophaga sp.]
MRQHLGCFSTQPHGRQAELLDRCRGGVVLDVREWYHKPDGEAAPTKKGVRFDAASLHLIQQHLPAIQQAAQPGGPSTSATASSNP